MENDFSGYISGRMEWKQEYLGEGRSSIGCYLFWFVDSIIMLYFYVIYFVYRLAVLGVWILLEFRNHSGSYWSGGIRWRHILSSSPCWHGEDVCSGEGPVIVFMLYIHPVCLICGVFPITYQKLGGKGVFTLLGC